MSEFINELDSTIGKGYRKGIFTIITLLIVYILFALLFSFWPFSTIGGIIKKTTSSEAVINNYEWFYDQYNVIQAQKENIKVLPDTAIEKAGMIMVLNRAIAEYNSRSKQITRNMWKASDLPYQIMIGE